MSTNHWPVGLDTTGVADSSVSLQAFYDALPSDASVSLDTDATYRMDAMMQIENLSGLTINFNGSLSSTDTQGQGTAIPEGKEHLWPRKRGRYSFDSVENLVLSGGILDGGNANGGTDGIYSAALEAQHAIELQSCTTVTISGMTLQRVWGDGLLTNGSNNVEFTDNSIRSTSRQGAAVTSGDSISIHSNVFWDIRRSRIDLEPNNDAQVISNVTMSDNTAADIRLTFLAAASGKGTMQNISIVNERTADQMNIKFGNLGNDNIHSNVTMTGCEQYNNFGSPLALLRFFNTNDILISNNTAPLTEGRAQLGVSAESCCSVTVSSNSWIISDVTDLTEIDPRTDCLPDASTSGIVSVGFASAYG